MATRGYLEQVKMGNVNERDARDVTEGASDAVVLVIDDEWSTALNATTIPHFTLARTESTRVFHLQTHHRHDNISMPFHYRQREYKSIYRLLKIIAFIHKHDQKKTIYKINFAK